MKNFYTDLKTIAHRIVVIICTILLFSGIFGEPVMSAFGIGLYVIYHLIFFGFSKELKF